MASRLSKYPKQCPIAPLIKSSVDFLGDTGVYTYFTFNTTRAQELYLGLQFHNRDLLLTTCNFSNATMQLARGVETNVIDSATFPAINLFDYFRYASLPAGKYIVIVRVQWNAEDARDYSVVVRA
jgi:hypothetical protein